MKYLLSVLSNTSAVPVGVVILTKAGVLFLSRFNPTSEIQKMRASMVYLICVENTEANKQ